MLLSLLTGLCCFAADCCCPDIVAALLLTLMLLLLPRFVVTATSESSCIILMLFLAYFWVNIQHTVYRGDSAPFSGIGESATESTHISSALIGQSTAVP